MKPETIAVVGISDNSPFSRYVNATLGGRAEVFLVNPNYETVLGQPTVPSLSSVDRPVDLVVSFMGAERTTALVEEAAGLDVGGLVLVAAAFAEMGAEGARLQERIRKAASSAGLAVMGPNGLGYVNVPRGISLNIAGLHKRRPGGISVVSHSGGMLTGVALAAWAYEGCGMNMSISAGNEAVTDLADYVGYLADDPETTSIGLIVETIRRPREFFAAVARATEAGKPVVALKLARNERTQKLALSHTASVAGSAWVYDVAFRQAGVALAYDIEELVDRLAMVEQIPPARWSAVENLGVLARTGGFASLSYDVARAEGVTMPPLDSFAEWAQTTLPGVTVPNPLDATSQGIPIWPQITEKYARSDELDALVLVHPSSDDDEQSSTPAVTDFAKAAALVSKPCVLVNCAGAPAGWVKPLTGDVVALGRGVRPTMRGLQTLGAFVRRRSRSRSAPPDIAFLADVASLACPDVEPVQTPEGLMVPFDATLELLSASGVPVAPYRMVEPGVDPSSVDPGFTGPYAVKLANVAHRSEHGAVRLGVAPEDLPAAVADLRAIAGRHGLRPDVVIQPSVEIVGETLAGIQGSSELGPIVVFGLGGIFVEALNRVGGRMAPFSVEEAEDLVGEFEDLGLMHGARGREPWDLDALARILVGLGKLAAAGRDWIASLDVNPLVYTPDGFVAVDAVLLLRGQSPAAGRL